MTYPGLETFLVDTGETKSNSNVGEGNDYKLCACGCGTKLPLTYKWAYKRGHKLAAESGIIPKDPDRPTYSDEEIEKATSQAVELTEEMRNDIQGQLAFVGSVVAMLWGTRDPICAGAFGDNIEAISEKAIPLISRSPRVVQWMLGSNSLLDILAFGIALKPVISTWSAHHITHTIGDRPDAPENYSKEEMDFSYPIGS